MLHKINSRYLIIALIFCLGILSACKDNGDEVSSAPTAENTPTSEPTETPTEEPTATPTDTPVPTDTATPEPTDTPTPTSTPEPTSTDTPGPTDTPTPTEIPTDVPPTAVPPTAAPVNETPTSEGSGGDSEFPLPLPSGAPASEWNGIPIMPQAIAGGQGDGSYYFTTNASVLTVQNYYQSQLINLGWVLFAQTVGQNDGVILIFQHQTTGETLSIVILTIDANTRYVLLVR